MAISTTDYTVAKDCIQAIVEGPFIDDDEFGTVMGVTRDEARRQLADWSLPLNRDTCVTANNAMNNLSGYPHDYFEQLEAIAGHDLKSIRATLARFSSYLRSTRNTKSGERE